VDPNGIGGTLLLSRQRVLTRQVDAAFYTPISTTFAVVWISTDEIFLPTMIGAFVLMNDAVIGISWSVGTGAPSLFTRFFLDTV